MVLATFSVLRHRSFRYLFLARTVSLLGTAMAPIALAFAVLDMPGGSATMLGLTLAGRSVAQVLLLLFGGVLADRMPRFRLLIASDLLAFLGQAAIAALVLTNTSSTIALVLLNMLGGAAGALFLPASRGAVTDIVAKDDLQSANGLLRLSRNSTSIIGIALGGVLVTTVGGGWALACDAATFLVSAALLAGVRVANSSRPEPATLLADLLVGWREFTSRRWIWLVVVQFSFVNLCFTTINVLGPLTAKQRLGGPAAWAVITTAMSVGLVVGSLVAMRIRPQRPMRTAVLATFGFLPPFALLALGAPVWLIAASMLVNGVCVDIFEVLWDTSLQHHVPAESISRISSYDVMASFVLGPVGLVLVGPISTAFGVTRTILAAGALLTVVTMLTFASTSVRSLRAVEPEPELATSS
jgi:MFS family permease